MVTLATRRETDIRRAWFAAGLLLAVLVAIASLAPGGDAPLPFAHADKLVHLVMHGLLAGWFACLPSRRRAVQGLLLALLAYGALLEIGQLFVPGRDFDLLDLGANAAGTAAGLSASWLIWNPLQWLQDRTR